MQNAKLMEPYRLTPVTPTITPPWGDIPNALSSAGVYPRMTPGLHPGRLPPSRGGIKGITLIELLVAISLLTLIFFAGSVIYLSGWSMFRGAQSIAQAQRNAMIPMAHMIKNLQKATSFLRIAGPPLELQFTVNPLGTTPIDIRRYIFNRNDNNRIEYDNDINSGNEQVIGQQIVFTGTNPTTFTISHNGVVANITITATDNDNHNPISLTSIVEARYGASPPV